MISFIAFWLIVVAICVIVAFAYPIYERIIAIIQKIRNKSNGSAYLAKEYIACLENDNDEVAVNIPNTHFELFGLQNIIKENIDIIEEFDSRKCRNFETELIDSLLINSDFQVIPIKRPRPQYGNYECELGRAV